MFIKTETMGTFTPNMQDVVSKDAAFLLSVIPKMQHLYSCMLCSLLGVNLAEYKFVFPLYMQVSLHHPRCLCPCHSIHCRLGGYSMLAMSPLNNGKGHFLLDMYLLSNIVEGHCPDIGQCQYCFD